jgi:hypothetical protein
VTQLPPPLKPWASALQLFPHELAVGLGAWLPRLAMALGPLRTRTDEGRDEPDGFDGLSRQGPYERLLPAEWALADAFPEEFTRRAASGEHAFFRLAFHSPAGERRCLALLDAGPSQLGAPRLAHLAALLVLERRAREARAEFLWGVLQQPPGRCLTRVDASAVEHWMRARCAVEPREEDLRGWREFFGKPAASDELWLVGGRRALGLKPNSALVVHEGEARTLEVDVRPSGAPTRSVKLPLPSDELCTRLIRDPLLHREAVASRGSAPESNLCFLAGGGRLAYLTRSGELVIHVVPGAPTQSAREQRVKLPNGEALLAVGWDRGLVTVTQQGTAVRWCWYSKRASLRGQGAWHLHSSDSHPAMGRPRTLGSCLGSGWFFTARGELVCTEMNRTYRVTSLNAAGIVAARQRLVAVVVGKGSLHVEWHPGTPDEKEPENYLTLVSPGLVPEARVVFGFDQLSRLGVMAAVSAAAGRWHVLRLGASIRMFTRATPDGATVVGALMGPAEDYEPGLLVIEKDGQTLSACFGDHVRRVLHMTSRIVRCAVSPFSSHVALHTEAGHLCVFSLRRQQTVLSLSCGGEA